MNEYLDIKRSVGFRKIEFLPSFLDNLINIHNSKYGTKHAIDIDFNYKSDTKPEMEFVSSKRVACKTTVKTTQRLEEVMAENIELSFNPSSLIFKTSYIITRAYAEYHPNIGRMIYFTIKSYYIKPTLFQLLYHDLFDSTTQENNPSKKQRKK